MMRSGLLGHLSVLLIHVPRDLSKITVLMSSPEMTNGGFVFCVVSIMSSCVLGVLCWRLLSIHQVTGGPVGN